MRYCGLLFLSLLGAANAVAQVEEPPPIPPPPPVGAPVVQSREIVWTDFARSDWGVSGRFPTEVGKPRTWLWHLGATEFVSSNGLRLQTSIEYTTLFNGLRSASLDSLARFYWTQKFSEKQSVVLSRDSLFVGVLARYVEIKSNVDGARWRVMLTRPDSSRLIAFQAKVYDLNGREDAVADDFFASIAQYGNLQAVERSPEVLVAGGGRVYVNDTLGYSIKVHRTVVSRETLTQGPITVYSRVTDDCNDLPAIFIHSVIREHNASYPALTAEAMSLHSEQQGFRRRGSILVDGRPAVMLEMTNEYGDYWRSYVIEVSGGVIHSVLVGVPGYWGSSFAEEVIASVRLRELKKP